MKFQIYRELNDMIKMIDDISFYIIMPILSLKFPGKKFGTRKRHFGIDYKDLD